MVTCLLLYYSILLNLATNQTLVVGHSVPFYLATTSLILTISALPYHFLAVPYLVFVTAVGESFDASSTHPTDLLLLLKLSHESYKPTTSALLTNLSLLYDSY